ncbi:hypothetical protein GCM10025872_22370 [Barrientosiimonas endolithica]|uniref:Uncharacterized protein n=1 Tax=Barrientosiimonas endolithica TaxID=1535208 RepID=A0ABN6YRC1_9MICO|nr:hypothetical protein GCM10025872_22370 [Barrientosiimonas endolithica]
MHGEQRSDPRGQGRVGGLGGAHQPLEGAERREQRVLVGGRVLRAQTRDLRRFALETDAATDQRERRSGGQRGHEGAPGHPT